MKTLAILGAGLAAVIAATPAAAQVSANPRATATVRLVQPLTLTAQRNLDFGTIVMGTLGGSVTVSMSQAGIVTCATGLTCTGAPQSALYRVTGTQGQQVIISSATPTFTLTGSNGGTMAFTPSFPASITLGALNAPANDFNVGGSIVIASNQQDGVYSGQIDIQVAYQ